MLEIIEMLDQKENFGWYQDFNLHKVYIFYFLTLNITIRFDEISMNLQPPVYI